jgi:hypothetical protein
MIKRDDPIYQQRLARGRLTPEERALARDLGDVVISPDFGDQDPRSVDLAVWAREFLLLNCDLFDALKDAEDAEKNR